MIKLLISDLDDTLYDWTGFFVPAFYAMADEIARMTGIDEKKLLKEARTVPSTPRRRISGSARLNTLMQRLSCQA